MLTNVAYFTVLTANEILDSNAVALVCFTQIHHVHVTIMYL